MVVKAPTQTWTDSGQDCLAESHYHWEPLSKEAGSGGVQGPSGQVERRAETVGTCQERLSRRLQNYLQST